MVVHNTAYAALMGAVNHGEIFTVFQPILSAAQQCVGFEALSRFPNGCPPNAVWALAHSLEMAVSLDSVALATAIRSAQSLPGKLFLNISAAHFAIVQALLLLGPPDRLVWEVTESGLISDMGVRGIQILKTMGYAVAMDDAGSGYATENRLKVVQPDIVKLDFSVVHQWGEKNPMPLRRWVDAARQIGAVVLAEGVEDLSWIEGLKNEGVQALQGYALGKPAPAAEWLVKSEFSGGG
ncbi:MAG: EAL domain-containing protein, partial [Sulfobacillus benefaciens]